MRVRAFAFVVVAFMAAAAPRATTLVPADLGELSRDALAIVRGRVAAVDGQWTDDRRGIETIVTLDVDEYLKGDLGATVRFRLPGGLLGRFRSIVVGAPRFAVDDRVVVFLGAKGPMIPFLVGFSQGVYRVVRDPAARDAWRVTPPIVAADAPAAVVRGDPSRVPLPLDVFEARVRALARNGR
ncbi:MAG TPA: hypothetical protein VKH42_20470 [Vicinamibacterales bacterium]|nr:hypothetical protein [Vicinamibacterales bacterium]